MSSEWISNEIINKRVKELLEQAGIPLEIKTASLCRQFCDYHKGKSKKKFSAEQLVYTSSQDEPAYRELDCKVNIYEEFEVNKQIGIQLGLEIPVECKYRKNVETFGFLSPISTTDDPLEYCFGFPITSYFARTNYFRSLINSYKSIRDPAPHKISLIEITSGNTPIKIHEENLVFNAASSLYDFIQISLDQHDNTEKDPTVDRLFKSFKDYLVSTNYAWYTVYRSWALENINHNDALEYNKRYFGGRPIYHGITAHLPIICTNGPIYLVSMTSDLHVSKFVEKPFICSSIRKQGWSCDYSSPVVFYSPEVSIFITNPTGLFQLLEMGLKWHSSIRRILRNAPIEIIEKAPIEAEFFNRVIRFFESSEKPKYYRSDLDLRNWF